MVLFTDFNYSKLTGKHLWKLGMDYKNHQLKSESQKLYGVEDLRKDNFRNASLGFYIQDEWYLSDKSELSLGLRLDHIQVDWTEYTVKDNEVDDYVFAPRMNYVLRHTPALTSRVNAGLGYRAPLTLYESQHGSNHDGFEIQIDQIEKAYGFGYALDYQKEQYSLGLTVDHSILKDLSYGEDEHPIIFKNLETSAEVTALGVSSSYQVLPSWAIFVGYDHFLLTDNFASTLPTAAIEDRVIFQSDNHFTDKIEFLTKVTLTGSRSLTRYDYGEHYNTFDGTNVSNQKRQKAPSFFTIDVNLNYKLQKHLAFSAGILNLFDYTQTHAGDSPLTWVEHEPGDVHLDNFHIWGPTMGRQLFAGLTWTM